MDLPARIGRYEVELLLGEGAVGRVLLARDPILRRHVAIKVLRSTLDISPDQREKLADSLRQEVRSASTLSHPAMVAIYDMGEDAEVGPYVVFELVRGATLRERLHDGPLPPGEVAQIARALGAVLTHAHVAGLVHRGVRPENIMLTPTGPKLTDFGISPADGRLPAYSSPEVLATGSFSAETDQFSLAATLYEALTGRRAFAGDDPTAVAAKAASGIHSAPRSVLPALRGFLRLDMVFVRAFAKNPKNRFASCDAFALALAAELEGPRVTFLATPPQARSGAARSTRRWQNSVALVAVLVILSLLLIGRFHQQSEDRTARPMQRVAPSARSVHSTPPSTPMPTSAPMLSATGSTVAAKPSIPSTAASSVDP